MAELTLRKVVKRFGQVEIIHGVDLEILDGEFVVFVGPSGCGKSTLLRMIAGLEELTDGELRIGDRVVNDVEPAARGVAMVFQTYALYPHMTVEENMSFGLRMSGLAKPEIKKRVDRAADILHLTPLLKRRPAQLSGGQRQRVAIGRAIVREPKVFLFDEPLSNLDAELRVQMRIEISKLHYDLKTTMIYVTHDQVEAMTLADKIVILNRGQIEQVGRPMDLYLKPANLFVAGFMGSPKMNFLKILSAKSDGKTIRLDAPDFQQGHVILEAPNAPPIQGGKAFTLGIRPEHIAVTQQNEGKGVLEIEVVESLGDTTYLHGVTPGGNYITVSITGFHEFKHGDTIGFDFAEKDAHLFDSDGKSVAL
jgi:lactose/L-arabinose transport system ATP-binding protein